MEKQRIQELAGIAESVKPREVYPGDLDDVIFDLINQDSATPIYIAGPFDDSMVLVSTKQFNPKD